MGVVQADVEEYREDKDKLQPWRVEAMVDVGGGGGVVEWG